MVKKLKFKIDKEGNVEVDVQGAQGSECENLTKPFEQLLGQVEKREHKDSFYQQSQDTADIGVDCGQ